MVQTNWSLQSRQAAINWSVTQENSHVKALTANVSGFGEKAFKEAVKIKWGHKGRALILHDQCPQGRRKRHQGWAQRKATCEDTEEGSHLQATDRPHEKPHLLTPWSWSSSLHNWDNKCVLFNSPLCRILLQLPELTKTWALNEAIRHRSSLVGLLIPCFNILLPHFQGPRKLKTMALPLTTIFCSSTLPWTVPTLSPKMLLSCVYNFICGYKRTQRRGERGTLLLQGRVRSHWRNAAHQAVHTRVTPTTGGTSPRNKGKRRGPQPSNRVPSLFWCRANSFPTSWVIQCSESSTATKAKQKRYYQQVP